VNLLPVCGLAWFEVSCGLRFSCEPQLFLKSAGSNRGVEPPCRFANLYHYGMITSQMFNQEKIKQQQGRRHNSEANSSDPTTRLFGTVVPSSIPESTEWWKVQSRCLFAISDDSELGIMQEMVTITGTLFPRAIHSRQRTPNLHEASKRLISLSL